MLTTVIPTYRRERVLLDTLSYLFAQSPPPDEILVIDQTERHEPATERTLTDWNDTGRIRWLRLPEPSIPRAMNCGLIEARHDLVLFLDDDIIPEPGLIATHVRVQGEASLVAGRVVQPWDEGKGERSRAEAGFAATERGPVEHFMGGNFSVRRDQALAIGGFDENFVRVAYHFEREFAARWRAAGDRIHFEPDAAIHHLKATAGGTRSYGHHLTTARPDHAVGAYYYLLRTARGAAVWRGVLQRLGSAVATRHHLRRPWWIPLTLTAELTGLCWALQLAWRGPRYPGASKAGA